MNAQTPFNQAAAEAFRGFPDAAELIALDQRVEKRSVGFRESAIEAARSVPGLSPVVARWAADEANEFAKSQLHTIADLSGDDAAAEKADRIYARARAKAEKSAYAILDYDVVDLAEAEAKVHAFVASRHASDISTIPCEEDVAALAEAMLADLKKLRERADQEPACDAAALQYVGLKGKLDDLASQNGDVSDEYDVTLAAWDAATDRLMAEAATGLVGIAARLRAILEHGLSMDLDTTSESFQTLLSAPPTAEELYGPHGQGAEDPNVLRRAIARLYWDVEQLAGQQQRIGELKVAAAMRFAEIKHRYERTRDAWHTCDQAADEAAGDPVQNAYLDALEELEDATPATLEDLAYVMHEAMAYAVGLKVQDFDSADYFSDLLGSTTNRHERIAARTYLSVLKLLGRKGAIHEATSGPAFDARRHSEPTELAQAYHAHHEMRRAVAKAHRGKAGYRVTWRQMHTTFDWATRNGLAPDEMAEVRPTPDTVREHFDEARVRLMAAE